jgi:hypothetical protein
MEENLRAVLKTIEDDPHYYQHQLARWGLQMAIQNLSPKGVLPDTAVKEVLETLYTQTEEALSGLWEVLGVHPPPDLKERLTKRGLWHVFGGERLEGFSLHAKLGVVTLDAASGLHAVNKKAFLRTSNRKSLERTWEGVKALRPLLATMGLPDLEGALEVLLGLEEGKGRVEKGHVVVRSGGFWALWRGTFLGDPDLDVQVLAERDVVLPLTEGVALSFRVRFACSKVYVDRLGIHREGDNRYVERGITLPAHLFSQDPVAQVLQRELDQELHLFMRRRRNVLFEGLPPEALDRLVEFAQAEDPSVALRHLLRSSAG